MNKKTTFKWISFIGNSEDWMESYSGNEKEIEKCVLVAIMICLPVSLR